MGHVSEGTIERSSFRIYEEQAQGDIVVKRRAFSIRKCIVTRGHLLKKFVTKLKKKQTMEGYLQKKNPSTSGWKQRYFVVRGNELVYSAPGAVETLGNIFINKIVAVKSIPPQSYRTFLTFESYHILSLNIRRCTNPSPNSKITKRKK